MHESLYNFFPRYPTLTSSKTVRWGTLGERGRERKRLSSIPAKTCLIPWGREGEGGRRGRNKHFPREGGEEVPVSLVL